MAFAFVSRVLKGYMVDAVGWWKEEWELIRYGKETSTVKQVDDLNCGTPMDSVSYSVNTKNPQLYGCAVLELTAQNQNQALDNLSKRHQIIGGDELDA